MRLQTTFRLQVFQAMRQQPCNNSHATTAMQQQPCSNSHQQQLCSNSHAAPAKQQQLSSNSQATTAMQQQPPATMQQQPCSTSQAATAMQQQPSMQLSGGSGCTSRLHVQVAFAHSMRDTAWQHVGGKTLHVTQGSSTCMSGLLVLHCYHDNRSRAKRSMAARWRQNFTCHTGLVCMHVRVLLH